MAFKPANSGSTGGDREFEPRNFPTPKHGLRPARISLIVDLGIQKREDFEEEDGTKKPQKPCHQIAVFADLPKDVVDYGGDIGKKQYRLLLNKQFKGVVQGINFVTGPAKDGEGNVVRDKPWCLHPANLLTKLAKAIGKPELAHEKKGVGLDIEPMMGEPFMADVEVKKTEHKEGKKDSNGNVIVYTNVNFKAAAPVPEDYPIGDLEVEAKIIAFDSATKADIQLIRSNLLKQIKLAENYAGSQMQKAVEAWEAEQGESEDEEQEEPSKPEPKADKPKPKAKVPPKAPVEDMEDDVPFN